MKTQKITFSDNTSYILKDEERVVYGEAGIFVYKNEHESINQGDIPLGFYLYGFVKKIEQVDI